MIELRVSADGWLEAFGRRMRCALGRSGISTNKREGDGTTPEGLLPLRQVLYRPDRLAKPVTTLSCAPIGPGDGWCDDPAHPDYNRAIRLPHPARHERLWRDDHLYDLLAVLGHNDAPPIPGLGSAIFLHLAKPDYGPTEGCVALALADLRFVLSQAKPGDGLRIGIP